MWLLVLATFASVGVWAADITVHDRFGTHSSYGVDPRPGIDESGSVSPGAIVGPTWDLRGLAFEPATSTLTSIGGFNPLTSNLGFRIGDIFIDMNGDAGIVSRPAVDGYFPRPNPGFEYVIHLGAVQGNALQYDIYQLDAGSMVETGYYHQFGLADPWALLPSGETLLDSGIAPVTTMSSADVFNQFGVDVGNNGLNYLIGFDLPFLAGQNFEVYQTIQCLNDSIQGSYNVVPESGTMVAGFGVLGVIALAVRRRKLGTS